MLKTQTRKEIKKSPLNFPIKNNQTTITIPHNKKLPILLKKSKNQPKKHLLKRILTQSQRSSSTRKTVKNSQRELLNSFKSRRRSITTNITPTINSIKENKNFLKTNSSYYQNFDFLTKNSNSNSSSTSNRNNSFYDYNSNDEYIENENSTFSLTNKKFSLNKTLPSDLKFKIEGGIKNFKNNLYYKTGRKITLNKFLKQKNGKHFLNKGKKDSYDSIIKLISDEIELENYYKKKLLLNYEEPKRPNPSEDYIPDDLINIISLNDYEDYDSDNENKSSNFGSKLKNKLNYESSSNISIESIKKKSSGNIEGKKKFDQSKIFEYVVKNRSREESHHLFIKCKFYKIK